MRAVDTNVLVRLITRDEPRQVATAEAFVAEGAWVSHVVLAETIWVLTAVDELGPPAIATALEMLLNHRTSVYRMPMWSPRRLGAIAPRQAWSSPTVSSSR